MYKDRIRAARAHAQLSQIELAQAVGMHQTAISGLERGHSASSAHTAHIAKACGVNELWLERGEGQMLSPENPHPVAEHGKRTHFES
ncbi:helix-turn-helix transcriptional regulator [Pseudomonas sp.]|uniref:helix-turn-helix domain-containing protein n=1 Tax=Pseudomonas sp. TaxID=306 RepID=UPI002914436C|nr:helix-turn-helix transcriptional regulator [Pseudomonas sp.]MDU4249494.1 helix-turn-helix transcriptional regulator [Pseudomonas sp.]